MAKQLITFSFAALMTAVAFGQTGPMGPSAYTIGVLLPMDDIAGRYPSLPPPPDLNKWCQFGVINVGVDGQFTGLEWEAAMRTGNLICCFVRDDPNDPINGEFFTIDPFHLTAPPMPIGIAPADMTDLGFNEADPPNGKMYSIDAADNLYRDIDGDFVPETLVGTFPIGGRNVGLAFDDNGDLYVLDYVTDSIYKVPSADVLAGDLTSNIETVVGPTSPAVPMGFNSDGSQGLDFFDGNLHHAAFNASFGQGDGAVLFDSPPSQLAATNALVNQQFPDFPEFSTYMVCDVTLGADTPVGAIDIWSTDTVDGAFQANVTQAVLNIFPNNGTGLPTDDDNPTTGILVPITIEEVIFDNGTPENTADDFSVLKHTACGIDTFLKAGDYWVGLTFDAEFGINGQSFTIGSDAIIGEEAAIRNPGGGFGFTFGTNWGMAGTEIKGVPWEMALQIRGTEPCGRAEHYTWNAQSLIYQFEGEYPNDVRLGDLTLSSPPAFCGGGFCPPTSYIVFRGIEISGALSDFVDSDDVRARYNPGFVLSSEEAPVWLEFFANCPTAIDFLVESQAGTPGLSYIVEAWNWNTAAYDIIGTQGESFNADAVTMFTITPADHIDTGGDVRSRVGWRKTGLTLNFPWEMRVDQVGWNQ